MFWETFYKICTSKNTSPNAVAKVIGVSSATCTHWKNGAVPNGETLVKLADYLSVSVDYLLGRADAPAEYSHNSISNSSDVALGVNAQVNKSGELDGLSREMIAEFEKLEFSKKAKVISLIAELSET